MTDDQADLISSININNILVAILEVVDEVEVPADILLNIKKLDKELVIDYDESGASFLFRLRNTEDSE